MNESISQGINDWEEFSNNCDHDRILFQKINIIKNNISELINIKRITLHLYKQESLVDCIFNCMIQCELYFYIFKSVVIFLKGNVFDFMGGNIFKKLRIHLLSSKQKNICFHIDIIINFYKKLSTKIPAGLNISTGTCGCFEFLIQMIWFKSNVPREGNIKYNNKLIKLKGIEVRIKSHLVQGIIYYKKMKFLIKKYR